MVSICMRKLFKSSSLLNCRVVQLLGVVNLVYSARFEQLTGCVAVTSAIDLSGPFARKIIGGRNMLFHIRLLKIF